ncbi:hypothetical protein J8273_0787 [Carpediemonas membranifera]|uniref:Uncharacterized protein n=1 Tax=Carpediemonas membranifera TaxID=201153 RepID=A0A8J6E6Y9_9EUKA|nr:hypothetical protein J8273_0787 [Carpediemonas membranifera]|eukprot:KAG9397657.1 hypothetical protein J8273_0787 [Carpediemonas membranifera]
MSDAIYDLEIRYLGEIERQGAYMTSLGLGFTAAFLLVLFQICLCALTPCGCCCASSLLDAVLEKIGQKAAVATASLQTGAPAIVTAFSSPRKMKHDGAIAGATVLVLGCMFLIACYFTVSYSIDSTANCNLTRTGGSVDVRDKSVEIPITFTLEISYNSGIGSSKKDEIDRDIESTVRAWAGDNLDYFDKSALSDSFEWRVNGRHVLYETGFLKFNTENMTVNAFTTYSRIVPFSLGAKVLKYVLFRKYTLVVPQSTVTVIEPADVTFTMPTAVTLVVEDDLELGLNFSPSVMALKFMRPDPNSIFQLNTTSINGTSLITETPGQFGINFAADQIESALILMQCKSITEQIGGAVQSIMILLVSYPIVKTVIEVLSSLKDIVVPGAIFCFSFCWIPVTMVCTVLLILDALYSSDFIAKYKYTASGYYKIGLVIVWIVLIMAVVIGVESMAATLVYAFDWSWKGLKFTRKSLSAPKDEDDEEARSPNPLVQPAVTV